MSRCRTCHAEIMWARTTAGRLMPIDAEPDTDWDTPIIDPAGNVRPTGRTVHTERGSNPEVEVIDPTQQSLVPERRWRSHFATCPDADSHRRPR